MRNCCIVSVLVHLYHILLFSPEKPEVKKPEILESSNEGPSEESTKGLVEEVGGLTLEESKTEAIAEVTKSDDKKAPKPTITGFRDSRPGTTKRRQYYYKQVAKRLSVGRDEGDRFHLYSLQLKLSCAIPDDQNTRGRSIFDPVISIVHQKQFRNNFFKFFWLFLILGELLVS